MAILILNNTIKVDPNKFPDSISVVTIVDCRRIAGPFGETLRSTG